LALEGTDVLSAWLARWVVTFGYLMPETVELQINPFKEFKGLDTASTGHLKTQECSLLA
jgi:hypothetical protein